MRTFILFAVLSVFGTWPSLSWGQGPNSIQLEAVTGAPDSTTAMRVFIDNSIELAGFQLALNFDPTLIELLDVSTSGVTTGAELVIASDTVNPGEYAWAVLLDFLPPFTTPSIPVGVHQEAATTLWRIPAQASQGSTIPVTIAQGAGDPVVETIFALDSGFSLYPTKRAGSVEVKLLNAFIRGDCDYDDLVELEDAVGLLNYLFQSGTVPPCDDACDANDDAAMDLFDVVYLLQYLFSNGSPPAAPFPSRGTDVSAGDGLGCNGDVDDGA